MKRIREALRAAHRRNMEKRGWYVGWHEIPKIRLWHLVLFLLSVMLLVGLSITYIDYARLAISFNNAGAKNVHRPKAEISSNRIIVKIKEKSNKKIKLNLKKEAKVTDTGIASLDSKNKKYKAKRLQKINKGGSANSGADAYYVVEFDVDDAVVELGDGEVVVAENGKESSASYIEKAIEDYEDDPSVEFAEPDFILNTSAVPNDPRYADLWGLERIDAPSAWDITMGSRDVVVAVVDTGIDFNHQDLQGNIWNNSGEMGGGKESNGIDDDGNGYVDDWRGYDFSTYYGGSRDNNPSDYHGHGTHVSGTIAAVGNNGIGVTGVNWEAKIMAVKGLSDSGSGYTSDLIEGILYAADNGAKVINNSWGGWGSSQALQDAIHYANGPRNSVVVVAAGNDRNDSANYIPASCENVITVSATDSNDARAYFSNWGDSVEVAAPGVSVLSTIPNGYGYMSGTSMSAPHVSGLAALVAANWQDYSAQQISLAITSSVDDVGEPGRDLYFGHGRINARKALNLPTMPMVYISSPTSDKSYAGVIEISGSAYGQNYNGHSLYYKKESEASWSLLAESSQEVDDGLLYALDTTGFEEGAYDLRLVVSGMDGKDYEYLGGFELDNIIATITLPAKDKIVRHREEEIAIVGTSNVGFGSFKDYSIEVGYGNNPTEWTSAGVQLSNGGLLPVVNDNLGSIDLSTYSSGKINIRLKTRSLEGSEDTFVQSLFLDFELLAGWPKNHYSHLTMPAFGDVDNDGEKEIVYAGGDNTIGGTIYVYKKSGQALSGWPQTISAASIPNAIGINMRQHPVLADIDGDKDLEIIVETSQPHYSNEECNGRIYVYNHDGTIYPGWPKELPHSGSFTSPAIGDMDNDGDIEIVYQTEEPKIYVFNQAGAVEEGWPKSFDDLEGINNGGIWRQSPALADIDLDGYLDIVTGVRGKIYVMDHNGNILEGWPQKFSDHTFRLGLDTPSIGGIANVPSIGDIDKDGKPEIVASLTGVNGHYGFIYAWNDDGTVVDGWPHYVGIPSDFDSGAGLVDLNDDGYLETVISTRANLYVLDHRGIKMPGWPVRFIGQYSSPAFSDINNDGMIEIIATSNNRYRGVEAYNYRGDLLWSRPYGYSFGGAVISDLDNNNNIELASYLDESMYIWELGSSEIPDEIYWPQFKRLFVHDGYYPYSSIMDYYNINCSHGPGGVVDPVGDVSVVRGENKRIEVRPSVGYHVKDVLVDGVSVGAVSEYTFQDVNSHHSLVASFEIDEHIINSTSGDGGSIDPLGESKISYGSSIKYSITPSVGYHVEDVLVDGVSVGAVSEYEFVNISKNHTIHALFDINTYNITVEDGLNGSLEPAGVTEVEHGGSFSFSVVPDEFYYVGDVFVNNASIGAAEAHTLEGVTEDKTIRATFVSTLEFDAFSISAPRNVYAGQSFSITISPLDQYGNHYSAYRGLVSYESSDPKSSVSHSSNYTRNDFGDSSKSVSGFVLRTAGQQEIAVTDSVTKKTSTWVVSVAPGPRSAFNTSVELSPKAPKVNEEVSVTITLRDAYDNPIPNHRLFFHYYSCIVSNPGYTNSQGVAVGTLISAFAYTESIIIWDGTAASFVYSFWVTFEGDNSPDYSKILLSSFNTNDTTPAIGQPVFSRYRLLNPNDTTVVLDRVKTVSRFDNGVNNDFKGHYNVEIPPRGHVDLSERKVVSSYRDYNMYISFKEGGIWYRPERDYGVKDVIDASPHFPKIRIVSSVDVNPELGSAGDSYSVQFGLKNYEGGTIYLRSVKAADRVDGYNSDYSPTNVGIGAGKTFVYSRTKEQAISGKHRSYAAFRYYNSTWAKVLSAGGALMHDYYTVR